MKPLLLCGTRKEAEHWMLDRLLHKSGLDRQKVVVRWLREEVPEGAPPAPAKTLADVDAWVREIGTHCVVTLGVDPLMLALGEHDIPRWLFRQVAHRWGTVIPLFDPSRFLPFRGEENELTDEQKDVIGTTRRKPRGVTHPPRFQGFARMMLAKAVALARAVPERPPATRFVCDPTVPAFEAWVDKTLAELEADPELVLNRDLETAYHLKRKGEEDTDEDTINYDTTIIRMGFAIREAEGVSVPFSGPYLPGIARLLGSRFPKVGWNSWAFDEEIELRNGLIVNGPQHDAQDAWHLLQPDLPRGLEWVTGLCTFQLPWKHLGDADPALYNAIDNTTNIAAFYWVRAQLRKAGQWDLYMRQVRGHVVLAKAGRKGLAVNEAYRQKLDVRYGKLLRVKLLKAQKLVDPRFLRKKLYKPKVEKIVKPPRLKKDGTPVKTKPPKPKPAPKPVDPKRARENWIWATVEIPHTRKICKACRRPNVNRKHACKVDPEGWNTDYTRMFEDEVVIETREYKAACAPGATLEQVKEWVRYNGFNPNSSDQVLAYMKHYRHPVGFNPKTEEDSADTKHLLELSVKFGAQHPIYEHIVDTHRLAKAHSTYVVGMKPDQFGNVYTTYVNVPTTWRLASRNKNLQNQSKRASNPYAKKTRRMFVSRYPRQERAA